MEHKINHTSFWSADYDLKGVYVTADLVSSLEYHSKKFDNPSEIAFYETDDPHQVRVAIDGLGLGTIAPVTFASGLRFGHSPELLRFCMDSNGNKIPSVWNINRAGQLNSINPFLAQSPDIQAWDIACRFLSDLFIFKEERRILQHRINSKIGTNTFERSDLNLQFESRTHGRLGQFVL